jgi:hypothetical protein
MNKQLQNELEAANLALTAALDEAITEYQDALAYKNEYLIEKHCDLETVAELSMILEIHRTNGKEILKEIQAEEIGSLKFPTELRKMWSGTEVATWLKKQANNKRAK